MTVAKEEKFMERVSNLLQPKKGQQSLLKLESKEEVLKLLNEGKTRAFKKSDYFKVEKGQKVFSKELEQLRKEIIAAGGNPDRITNSILKVRRDIDNMNLITLGSRFTRELLKKQ